MANKAGKLKLKNKSLIYTVLIIFFALIFVAASVLLTRELILRRQAEEYTAAIQNQYVPTLPPATEIEHVDNTADITETTDTEEAPTASANKSSTPNPTIQQLKSDYPDVIGWLTVEGAEVSHPFVQTDDNATYLWTDLNREYITGGTLFMDFYNSDDFSDKITVIYGHNMKNGTMFAKLSKYLDFDYLTENPEVHISLPYSTEHYTIAACMVVDGSDNVIYDNIGEKHDIQEVVDFIYANTTVNPDVTLEADSNILILSTCNRTFTMARTLLICIPD